MPRPTFPQRARLVHQARQPADDPANPVTSDRRHLRSVPLVELQIGLSADDEPGTFQQLGLVRAEFAEQNFVLLLGGHVVSRAVRSTITHSTRARSIWRRNWWPSPLPSLAPSIRPGMSATMKSVDSSRLTTPRCGSSVVNG